MYVPRIQLFVEMKSQREEADEEFDFSSILVIVTVSKRRATRAITLDATRLVVDRQWYEQNFNWRQHEHRALIRIHVVVIIITVVVIVIIIISPSMSAASHERPKIRVAVNVSNNSCVDPIV